MTITQTKLKEHLIYYPESGIFRHKTSGRLIGGKITKNNRYLRVNIKGKVYSLHRLAFLYMEGYLPEAVDHIDRNVINNSWENLRSCSLSQNQANAGLRTDNASGVKGLSWNSKTEKFQANVQNSGRQYTKTFTASQKIEAVLWLETTRKQLHEGFANNGGVF